MSYLGVPYTLAYEAKFFRTGLTNIVAAVRRPDGVFEGPFPLVEIVGAGFTGIYSVDYPSTPSKPEGEYIAVLVSPTDGVRDTHRFTLELRPNSIVAISQPELIGQLLGFDIEGNMIRLTQGDTANLNLTAIDGAGALINLTGATFTTFIQGPNGTVASFANGKHTANPDQVNFTGQFVLALGVADTQACGLGVDKEILTQIVIGSAIIYYRGKALLTVLPPTPAQ